MKQGRTLTDLAVELERQRDARRDFIADTRELTMLNGQELTIGREGEFTVNGLAHDQMGTYLGIPAAFYDRLRHDHPTLLDQNVNTLLRAAGAKRMVRTLDGHVRAFLSDRYRRLDNDELAAAILPVLAEVPDIEFPSTEVTETRLWITATTPRIQAEVKLGDVVQAGVRIRNSEVGLGSLTIEGIVYRLVCLNGMTTGDAVRRAHVGRRIGLDDDEAYEVFKDETLQADDRAFFLKVRDMTAAALSEARFQRAVSALREATSTLPMQSPSAGVEELGKRLALTSTEQASVLRHLALGGDLTMYGAIQAVTRAAHDVDGYDRSMELEAAGGSLLSLSAAQWREVANAGGGTR